MPMNPSPKQNLMATPLAAELGGDAPERLGTANTGVTGKQRCTVNVETAQYPDSGTEPRPEPTGISPEEKEIKVKGKTNA